jgi:hypothetical protein
MLLVLCVLAYGLLIPWLGYYFDEWSQVWAVHVLGPRGVVEVAASTRPLQGWAILLPTFLFGNKLVLWHLFALVIRWLSVVALWLCLRSVWPRKRWEVATAAILFAIYPGFSQQPISRLSWLTFAQMSLMFGSWWLSVRALRRPGRGAWSHTSAAALLVLALAPTEYFFGLELLRPVLMWTVLGQTVCNAKLRLRKVVLAWAPYFAILAAFGCWRLVFFRPETSAQLYHAETILARFHAHPLGELLQRAYGAVSDLLKAGVFSWVQTLPLDKIQSGPFGIGATTIVIWLASVCVGLAAAAVAAVALCGFSAEGNRQSLPSLEDARSWNRQALAIGFLAMCAGGLPAWFANCGITLHTGYDRFALALMVGSCLVAVGAVRAVLRTRRLQVLAVLALVALSVGFHLRNAELYRREWASMKSVAWQTVWRVPDVAPNSAFLMEVPLYNAVTLTAYNYSCAFDLIHRSAEHVSNAGCRFIVLRTASFFDGQESKKGIWPGSRGKAGDTPSSRAVMWISPSGTLWLLDSLGDEHPDLTPLTRAVQPLSNLNAVVSPRTSGIPSAPPVEVFGTEPVHGWLYYFQKICLARQLEQWGWASELADSARERSLSPQDPCEWLSVIEAYLTAGRFKDAESLVVKVARSRPEARSVLIGLLGRVKARQATSENLKHAVDDISEELNHEPKDH